MDIGKRLKEERERLGFNQSDFGALADIGRKSQFSYETSASKPDASYLAAIAKAGADIRYIITGERDGPPPLKPDEQTLLDGYRTFDAATKRRMLAFVLGGDPPASGKYSGNKIGQVIEGDYANLGDNSINFGGKKKK